MTTMMTPEAIEKAVKEKTDLSNGDFRGVDLSGRMLGGAKFAGCDFTGADLSGCDLDGADFSGAILAGASMSDSAAVRAKFDKADLTGADFGDTNIYGATFDECIGAHYAGQDPRGYHFIGVRGIIVAIYAGCRRFSVGQAVEHWTANESNGPGGDDDGPNWDALDRVRAICSALGCPYPE